MGSIEHIYPHRRIQGGLRGLKPPLNFSGTFFGSMVPDTETSIGLIFLPSLEINHFLHRDRDENIKSKAYFAEFGQSECVYFNINETSNKQDLFFKKYGRNVI